MDLPLEIYDIITFYAGLLVGPPIVGGRNGNPQQKQLGILRLVNRSFHTSASPLYFRRIRAVVGDWNCDRSRPNWPNARLVQLARSDCAHWVQEVVIGYDFSHRYVVQMQYDGYLWELAALLPVCMNSFRNLQTCIVDGPTFDGWNDLQFPHHFTRLLSNTVAGVLHYIPLPNLGKLVLGLPLAVEFGQFVYTTPTACRIPLSQVFGRLKALHLRIDDDSAVEVIQGYPPTPLSQAKARFPNKEYASCVFRLIEVCERLEDLQIACAEQLDLDDMMLGPSVRLRNLSVNCMNVSSSYLLSLLDRFRDSLSSITIGSIALKTGKWQDILLKMAELPRLGDVSVVSAGYVPRNPHAGRAFSTFTEPIPHDIVTRNQLEFYALGDLSRVVAARRRAMGLSLPVHLRSRANLIPFAQAAAIPGVAGMPLVEQEDDNWPPLGTR